jgi:hypothetical protein
MPYIRIIIVLLCAALRDAWMGDVLDYAKDGLLNKAKKAVEESGIQDHVNKAADAVKDHAIAALDKASEVADAVNQAVEESSIQDHVNKVRYRCTRTEWECYDATTTRTVACSNCGSVCCAGGHSGWWSKVDVFLLDKVPSCVSCFAGRVVGQAVSEDEQVKPLHDIDACGVAMTRSSIAAVFQQPKIDVGDIAVVRRSDGSLRYARLLERNLEHDWFIQVGCVLEFEVETPAEFRRRQIKGFDFTFKDANNTTRQFWFSVLAIVAGSLLLFEVLVTKLFKIEPFQKVVNDMVLEHWAWAFTQTDSERQLMHFYKQHDDAKANLKFVRELSTKLSSTRIYQALKSKYGAVPTGWKEPNASSAVNTEVGVYFPGISAAHNDSAHNGSVGANNSDKFTGNAAKDLKVGGKELAAHGLCDYMGITDEQESIFKRDAMQAIRNEFDQQPKWKGTDVQKCIQYVLDEEAVEKTEQLGWGETVRDKGHGGMKLADFLELPQAISARLKLHHIAALRIYSSQAYSCINDPLRAGTKPHPFAATTLFLSEAVKKLRTQHTNKANQVFYRGMRDTHLPASLLKVGGGTELGCMSTTRKKEVAADFAGGEKSVQPLVFRVVAKTFMNCGAEIMWLSVYPGEDEILYPPLTYLEIEKEQQIKGSPRGRIVDVMPYF